MTSIKRDNTERLAVQDVSHEAMECCIMATTSRDQDTGAFLASRILTGSIVIPANFFMAATWLTRSKYTVTWSDYSLVLSELAITRY